MRRRKRLAVVAASTGSFVAGLDATAVNIRVAGDIRAGRGGGLAGQQWVSHIDCPVPFPKPRWLRGGHRVVMAALKIGLSPMAPGWIGR